MKKNILLAVLALGLGLSTMLLMGCGSKKAEVSTAGDADAGPEPEADTGDADFPEPPQNTGERNPIKFNVSVNKAIVLPLSEDGKCWDPCSTESKNTLLDSLTSFSGEPTAKALTTAMGAKNTKDVLPDIYVNIDCGYGQTYATSKSSAEDRLAAHWLGAKEVLKLDPQDSCAISVWDADDDGNDEMLGATVVKPIQKAEAGKLTIEGAGQVVELELFFDQLEGESVWGGGGGGGGGGGTTPTTPTQPADDSKPAPETKPVTPPSAGASTYKVEVVKANMKKTKADGQPWDAKIPFVAGGVLPEPFVQAYVNGYKSEHPFMETSNAEEKLYYEWRESGEVNLKPSDKIHFMVWDKDKLDHDLMGECISGNVGSLKMGSEITIRDCGQVDFLVFKITKK